MKGRIFKRLVVAAAGAAGLGWLALGLFAGPTVTQLVDRSPWLVSGNLTQDGEPVATLVEAVVNGHALGWFALDSGAEASVLDRSVADTLALSRIGGGRAERCQIPFSVGRIASLDMGAVRFERALFAILDLHGTGLLEGLETPDGRPVVGLLGAPVFARTVVEIVYDAAEDRVAVHAPASFEEVATPDWLPLEVRDEKAYMKARFEGDREEWIRFDTGKAGSVGFYSRFEERASMLEGRDVWSGTNRRVCGDVEEHVTTLQWFELAGRVFQQPNVSFRIAGSDGDVQSWEEVGLVGQGFLRGFARVVFDYPQRRAAFFP